MTVEPNKSLVNDYVKEIKRELLTDNSEFWAIGRMIESIDEKLLANIQTFTSIQNLTDNI